jgi:hypothetical protein
MNGTAGAAARIAALDGPRLADALRAGIYRLLANQEHLNKINVFPVPDGDTGTNLAMTLSAVLGALDRSPRTHAGQLLTQVADAAIDGARGNSGAILAQFFLGLGDRLGHLGAFTTADFADGIEGGAAYARDAMTEPREGTILTVLKDYADALRAEVETGIVDFVKLLERAHARLRASLEATRGQLDELRRAGVVDAGALGFVDLMEGAAHYVATGQVPTPSAAIVVHDAQEQAAGVTAEVGQRYCTECTLAGVTVDLRRVREALAPLGSSLVVAGHVSKLKIHIHVNAPEAVFDTLRTFGEVSSQKADDMRRQQQLAHHQRGRGVAVITDSAADIPEEEMDRLGIHMVPVRVHFGSRSYLDKVGLTQQEFYRRLAASPEHPKTSQPPPGDFRRAFEFLASHFDAVIAVSLTGRVSGTLGAAQTAAARIATHGRVFVIDSENASLGQGLIAMYAAECAAAGYTGPEVRDAVLAIRPRTLTLALIGRLDYAVRGGRVPRFVKVLADLLHLTPVLMSRRGGQIGTGTVLFGRHRLTSRFARLIRRRLHPARQYRIAIGHANVESEGRTLLAAVLANLPNIHSSFLTTTGTALGVHGGPGMLVCAIQEYEPPQRRSVDPRATC